MPQNRRTRPISSTRVIAVLLSLAATEGFAAEAVDSFLSGLDAMAGKKYEQAAEAFGEAAKAKPDVAVVQMNHGIVLMLLGRSDESRDALARAEALNPDKSDIRVWSLVRAAMFDPAMPKLELPKGAPSYAPKVMVAAAGSKSPDAGERARARAAIEEAASEFAAGQRNGLESVKALYLAKRYREALAAIDAIAAKGPIDRALLGYVAHCKLGLGNYAAARESYTQALNAFPLEAGYLIGRARCEIGVGSLDAAESDLALAKRLDAKPVAALLAEAEQLLAKARQTPQTAPKLVRRLEEYTRELTRLQIDIRDHPNDVECLLALSRFHLQPTADCEVMLGGGLKRARVPCGKMDVNAADQAVTLASKLAPDEPRVLLQRARVNLAQRRLDDMMVSARRALAGNAMDLEVAVAYMQYNADAAKRNSAEARQLRARDGSVWVRDINGNLHHEHHGPTADEYTRAAELDREAKELRANATNGLKLLAQQTAANDDRKSRATRHMVDAYTSFWSANLDGAIAAAEQALAIDPVNDHTLRFLADACGKAYPEKSRQYRAVLDEVNRY